MADEVVKILRFETGEAVNSVKDLRAAMKECQDRLVEMQAAMGDAAKGTDEYKEVVEKLQGQQKVLNDTMAASKTAADNLPGSYNALNAELVSLRKRWKELSDEQRTADSQMGKDGILGKIQSLDTQLKNMDHSIGQNQRNVGDYAGQIAKISGLFGGAGKAASGAIGGAMGFTQSLKTMSATPVIAILGGLVTILSKVVAMLGSSEGATQKMTLAFTPLKVGTDAVTKVFQGLGSALAWVAGKISGLLEKWGLMNESMRERKALAEEEIKLTKQSRENIIANAEAQRDSAELRQKAQDKEKYTAEERVAFLEQAVELEKQMSERAVAEARTRYEIKKRTNALTESSTEDLDEEAKLYAEMVKAETDYYNKTKEMTSQIVAMRREGRSEVAADEAKRIAAEKALLEQELAVVEKGTEEELRLRKESRAKQYEADVASSRGSIKNQETLHKTLVLLERKYIQDVEKLEREHQKSLVSLRTQALKNTAELYAKGSESNLKALVKVRKYELDTLQQEEGESTEAFQSRQIAARRAYWTAITALNNKRASLALEPLTEAYSRSEKTAEQTAAYELAVAQKTAETIEQLGRQEGETMDAYLTRLQNAQRDARDKQEAYMQVLDNEQKQRLENDMNELVAGSTEYLAKAVELKQYELDTLHQLEGESDEAFRARQLAAEKAYTESKRELVEQQISLWTGYAGSISSIMGSVADIMEEGSDADEKSAQATKNLRIAGAIIDTLSGAVTAYTTAQSLGPIAGPVTGALNAAAVVAAGTAEIAKMRATTISKTSSGGVGSVSVATPTPVASIPTNTITTGASDEVKLNERMKAQKVYILSSDIEANGRRVEIRDKETSF